MKRLMVILAIGISQSGLSEIKGSSVTLKDWIHIKQQESTISRTFRKPLSPLNMISNINHIIRLFKFDHPMYVKPALEVRKATYTTSVIQHLQTKFAEIDNMELDFHGAPMTLEQKATAKIELRNKYSEPLHPMHYGRTSNLSNYVISILCKSIDDNEKGNPALSWDEYEKEARKEMLQHLSTLDLDEAATSIKNDLYDMPGLPQHLLIHLASSIDDIDTLTPLGRAIRKIAFMERYPALSEFSKHMLGISILRDNLIAFWEALSSEQKKNLMKKYSRFAYLFNGDEIAEITLKQIEIHEISNLAKTSLPHALHFAALSDSTAL